MKSSVEEQVDEEEYFTMGAKVNVGCSETEISGHLYFPCYWIKISFL